MLLNVTYIVAVGIYSEVRIVKRGSNHDIDYAYNTPIHPHHDCSAPRWVV